MKPSNSTLDSPLGLYVKSKKMRIEELGKQGPGCNPVYIKGLEALGWLADPKIPRVYSVEGLFEECSREKSTGENPDIHSLFGIYTTASCLADPKERPFYRIDLISETTRIEDKYFMEDGWIIKSLGAKAGEIYFLSAPESNFRGLIAAFENILRVYGNSWEDLLASEGTPFAIVAADSKLVMAKMEIEKKFWVCQNGLEGELFDENFRPIDVLDPVFIEVELTHARRLYSLAGNWERIKEIYSLIEDYERLCNKLQEGYERQIAQTGVNASE